MPAPTNISFLTATEFGTVETAHNAVTQTVDDLGTTYTVYYKFTAPVGCVEVGAWAFGDLAVYMPTLTPYNGPASAPTAIGTPGGIVTALNVPCQFPVTAGNEYFLKVATNAGNPTPADLTLSVYTAPNNTVAVGSIAVNDDNVDIPTLAIMSSTSDYTVLKFVADFAVGESGDVLDSGTICVENTNLSSGISVYNAAYQHVVDHVIGTAIIRTCLGAQLFYVADGSTPVNVYTVNTAGTLGAAEVLTAINSVGALAANNTQALLYHAPTGNAAAVHTWNLVTHAAGADLVAGLANYRTTDILVLGDDTILVGYYKSSVARDFLVKRFDAAGVLQNTYNFGVQNGGTNPRLAYAIDDPNSFWAFTHPVAPPALSRFLNIKVSDGSTLTTRNSIEFETGVSGEAATATPVAFFGNSFSCPFWITRVAASPTTETFTIRRQRRWLLPQSESNKRIQIPLMELLMRTGIGLLPDAAGSSTPLGVDPEVRLRISKDGGKTWGPERARSAGLRGEFRDRVRWTRATGNYRNGVGEVTVDAPVDWQWLAMMGDPTEGSS